MIAEKSISIPGISALLLDIEGTTTPIDFVHRTLFSYARAQMAQFLERHWHEPATLSDIQALRQQNAVDRRQGAGAPEWREETETLQRQPALAYLLWLMDRDSKCTPLKSIQGRIWQDGYRNGELHGEVYSDVPVAFERWAAQNKAVYIFSSGSVQAQRLLFGFSASGDLSTRIRGYFDTTTGPKREAASYAKIAASNGLPPQNVLFISDVAEELDAARAAGMHTALSVRPGAVAPAAGAHAVISDFDCVFP